MSSLKTCAYPYAKAIFNLAIHDNSVKFWLDSLKNVVPIIENVTFRGILSNPNVSQGDLLEIIITIIKDDKVKSADEIKLNNLFTTLVQNNKLIIIPQIYELYQSYVDEYNRSLQVTIYSAYPIDDEMQADLNTRLSSRLGKVIQSKVEIDSDLIGGIKIVINDMLIDMSIKGSLDKLTAQLI